MSNTPFKDKNSYENYVAHLKQLYVEAETTIEKFPSSSNTERLSLFSKAAGARFRLFDAFHDRYDITDELFGATIVPVALGLFAMANTLLALWEAGYMLAIKAGMLRNDCEQHGDQAVLHFQASIAASAFVFVGFFKSVVSLVTRTGFTLLDGWKKPKEDRFYEDIGEKMEDTVNKMEDTVNKMIDKVARVCRLKG